MKDLIEEKAKTFFDETEATFDGKFIRAGENNMTIEDFSTKLFYSEHQEQLVASGSYVGVKSPPPYMASICEVEVDKGTGRVKVLNYYGAVDCGVAINPNLAKVQVEGALMQGIGMTLYEETKRTDKGKLINDSFMRYKVPTRMEVGALHVHLVESYEPSGPFGAKSVGEIGIDTPPAAIANAIFNATGVRIRTLPITSEAVWRAMSQSVKLIDS
jgi:CO/xanthine dehydrogenase Mo-binding subunit